MSRSQAAWLKKRWKRDQWPLSTLPPEKMISVMIAVAMGEDPAGDDRDEGLEGRRGEDRGEML